MPDNINLNNCQGENPIGCPHIYLPLYVGDKGVADIVDRQSRNEYIIKKPFAVQDFTPTGLSLIVTNSGLVPSDLIMIEYQVVYCTSNGHGILDGFIVGQTTTIHAGEQISNEVEEYQTIDFIPHNDSKKKAINFAPIEYIDSVYNIYFRAKVSTVWHKNIPMKDWNFANDVTVVEAHLRVRP